MLEFKNVTKYYGSTLAVEHLSFQIKKGEILGLVGENGSGKTTTFRLLLRLLEPSEGEILFNDKQIATINSNIFGYLPEERSLYREQSVNNQLIFLGEINGMSKEAINAAIDYWVSEFGISDLRYKVIKQLSKGNQQKVQFIGCLLHNPQILILDEPFSGLDALNVKMFKEIFEKQRVAGKYILLSTHRLDHIEEFCSQVLMLKKGRTIMQGNIKELRQSYAKRYIRIMGDVAIHKLSDYRNIGKVVKEGKIVKVEMESPQAANAIIAQILKDFEVTSLHYELPTLQDIFFEKNQQCKN